MTARLLLLSTVALVGCAPPDLSFTFHRAELTLAAGPDAANQAFADFVRKADHTVEIALPAAADTTISDAILEAWADDLTVEVITDVDRAADPGIAALIDAGVPVTLADGELTYFDFNVNADIRFPSENTVMSDAWVIVDQRQALLADRVGGLASGEAILLELRGEEIIEDLRTEHNQIYGGTDATATTAFDGLAKSIADVRWRYPTQSDTDLELWFGPQERLTKRVIDAIYSARGSVKVLTNDLTETGLSRALQDKAKVGFRVEAVVGPAFSPAGNRMSQVFANETPDVTKRRFTAADDVPTVVIVDYDPGLDGKEYDTKVFVLTHDLFTASRLEGARPPQNPIGDDPWIGATTDQLIDGTLWVWIDYDEPSKSTRALHDLWQSHFDAAGSL